MLLAQLYLEGNLQPFPSKVLWESLERSLEIDKFAISITAQTTNGALYFEVASFLGTSQWSRPKGSSPAPFYSLSGLPLSEPTDYDRAFKFDGKQWTHICGKR